MISFPITAYNVLLQSIYSSYLIDIRYVTDAPSPERASKVLTRYKGLNGSLPENLCFIQYNRGPLLLVEEDDFRELEIIDKNSTTGDYTKKVFGFSSCELTYYLIANNGTVEEICEDLYYYHLYKIKTVDYEYVGMDFKSRVIHESLSAFSTSLALEEMGTMMYISWTVTLFCPILIYEPSGKLVETVKTDIYLNEHGDDLNVDPGKLIYSRIDPQS